MGTTLDYNNDPSSTMKSVIALCLFGLALGAPRPQEEQAIDLPDQVGEEVVEEQAPVEIAPVQHALAPFGSFAPLEATFRDYAEGESVSVLHDERSPVIGAVFNNELRLDNGILRDALALWELQVPQ